MKKTRFCWEVTSGWDSTYYGLGPAVHRQTNNSEMRPLVSIEIQRWCWTSMLAPSSCIIVPSHNPTSEQNQDELALASQLAMVVLTAVHSPVLLP